MVIEANDFDPMSCMNCGEATNFVIFVGDDGEYYVMCNWCECFCPLEELMEDNFSGIEGEGRSD